MNKKIFYSLVLMVMAAFMPAVAQETLTVYEGQGQSNVGPAYIFYWDDFTRSQVVFPAEQLDAMNGGQITALTFYTDQTAEYVSASTADVYLMEVDYTTMTAFEPKGDVLYSGTFTVNADGTITLQLATPYQYGGGNLLLGIENTTDAGYKNVKFYGQTGNTGASFAGYNSGSTDAVTGSVRDFIPKTTFTYTPGGGVIVPKPTALTIADVTTNSANISWTAGGEETSWNFEYKKKADEEWISQVVTTPSVALDALTNGCEYNVRVNAIAGENTSVWVTGNFVTPTCEDADKGEVSYQLTDSYGDGWSGNALEFYNSNGVLEATVTLSTGASAEGTVALCYGETYTIKWRSGSYGSECGFVVYGPGGDELVNHAQGTAPTAGQEFVTFLMEMPTCFTPKDLTVGTVTYNTAALSWTPGSEDQDAWQVAVGAAGFNPDQENYVYTDVTGEPNVTIENLTEGTKYDAYVRGNCGEGDVSAWSKVASFETPLQFPLPTELAVSDITAKSAVATWLGNCPAFNLRYRIPAGVQKFFFDSFEGSADGWTLTDADGDGNNWGLLHAVEYSLQNVPLEAKDGEYVLMSSSYSSSGALTPDNWLISPQLDLKGTLQFFTSDDGTYAENFSVYISTTGTATTDFEALEENIATPAPGEINVWTEHSYDLSDYEGEKGYIAIRHHGTSDQDFIFVDAFALNGEEIPETDWTVVENTTAPVTMQPLQPLTQYEVQVQGIYEGGVSGWTESVLFTTLGADAMPTNLFVNNITATTADANWEGSQDAYNLRYRTAGIYPGYEEGFEYGLASGEFPTESGWITIDADGDGYAWYTFTPDETVDNAGNATVLDASCMTSASYMGSALTPDDWLISPALDLGGTLSFQVRGQDPSWAAEHYAVYVSTGERTDLTSYVELIPESVSGTTYEEITADLSDYEGQTGYIAIRHFNCTDMFRLNIDNFKIIQAGDVVEPGEWQVVENVNSIYTIEGLTPETKYEVQVQGIVDEQNTTEWTASTFFTTLAEEETGFNEFYLVGDFNNWGDGVEPLKFEEVEDGVFEAKVDLPAGDEFKVITYGDDDQAIWMGGTDETGIGHYLITNELLNVPTTLWVGAGSNFKMQDAAVYIVRITEAQTTGLKGISAPLQIEFIYYAPTGIYDINADKGQSNEWYNLNGQKLNGKPVVPGIYINGGKKVIVK